MLVLLLAVLTTLECIHDYMKMNWLVFVNYDFYCRKAFLTKQLNILTSILKS